MIDFIDLRQTIFPGLTKAFQQILKEIDNKTTSLKLDVNQLSITKLLDFYNILYDLNGLFHLNIVIENIVNKDMLYFYKKNVIKFCELSLGFKEISIIFVSNFNILSSEINTYLNLNSFVSLYVNESSNTDNIKSIVSNKFYSKIINITQSNLIKALSFENFNYYMFNLNELVYNYGMIRKEFENKIKFQTNNRYSIASLGLNEENENAFLNKIISSHIHNTFFNISIRSNMKEYYHNKIDSKEEFLSKYKCKMIGDTLINTSDSKKYENKRNTDETILGKYNF